MTHLVPTLDHVVINVRDQIDRGHDVFTRLGFTLTPRGYHTLGSMNHLAMFGTDYLELIAAETGNTKRPEILDSPEGLDGLVFGTEDSAATFAALEQAAVPVFPPGEFSRPVVLLDGARDAVFRTVRLRPGTVPAGRLYFCQHFTRDLVWRDEWRHHANGVTGIARAVIADQNPNQWATLFRQMFGDTAVRPIKEGFVLTVGVSCFDVISLAALRAQYGTAAPDPAGRTSFMAALVLRTQSLDAAWTAIQAGGIADVRRTIDNVIVPAAEAFGATLVFCL